MKFNILISILAMVLVAGCSIPGFEIPGMGVVPGLGGTGLEIISFTAEPTPVYSGRTTRVVAEIENRGGTIVEESDACVYLTGSNIDLGGGTDYWTGKDADDKEEVKHFDKDMEPENVVRGTPADIERFSWTLVAPTLTPGQTRQDVFIIRVYNEYSSGVNGNIWVYTDAEAEATKAAGRALKTGTFTPVSGPVGVNVRVSPNPVVLYEDENEFTFSIDITNNAQGTIYYKPGLDYESDDPDLKLDPETQLNNINVAVYAPDLTIEECEGQQEIFGGRSMTLVCEVTINAGTPDTFKSYLVNVDVDYGYYSEREAYVTVQGRTISEQPEEPEE
ncbi:MAG: hypothetical protein GTN36_03580 [Candidatus Aenigmarchaeota archaeon]|nr:hypothetical protein [Candidatus Aenigmarchaeota archaeon]